MSDEKKIIDEAISLPVEARARIIDNLLKSINPVKKEIDDLWAKEVEKRVNDIKKGKAKTIPGKEVFKKIYDRF